MDEVIDEGGRVGTPTGAERYFADRLEDEEYKETYEGMRQSASFFDSLVEQEDDFIEASVPWAGTNQDKEAILNEVANMALSFTIARLTRFQHFKGTPLSVKVKICVDVDGTVEKTESGLILP